MLAGVFDGRASFDRRRGTQANTQFVVDCPLANEREVSELVIRLARKIGIGVNANFARERLQGGNPRKTQLRLNASEAKRLFENVGLVSPEKMRQACELYGCEKTIERDPGRLPGVNTICGVSTLVTRNLKSAGRSSESYSTRSKIYPLNKKATAPKSSACPISTCPILR